MTEYEYHTVEKPSGVQLSAEEVEIKKIEGWELCTSEPGIAFIPINNQVLSGPTARYIFRREKNV